MPASTIENHPQVAVIIEGIRKKIPYRKLAESIVPPVTHTAIQRYASKQTSRHLEFSRIATDSTAFGSKQWVEAQYVDIVVRAKEGKQAKGSDLSTAKSALDSIARLNGYDAPKRTESVSLSLRGIAPQQIGEHIRGMLSSLPESAKQQLLADPDIKTIETEVE